MVFKQPQHFTLQEDCNAGAHFAFQEQHRFSVFLWPIKTMSLNYPIIILIQNTKAIPIFLNNAQKARTYRMKTQKIKPKTKPFALEVAHLRDADAFGDFIKSELYDPRRHMGFMVHDSYNNVRCGFIGVLFKGEYKTTIDYLYDNRALEHAGLAVKADTEMLFKEDGFEVMSVELLLGESASGIVASFNLSFGDSNETSTSTTFH
jgi:hypothetical protein